MKRTSLATARRGQVRGFSLIELLVVMAIIALVSVGIATVGRTVYTNARVRNTKATIHLLVGALEEFEQAKSKGRYFRDNGFPAADRC